MASQPDDGTHDLVIGNPIDFDQIVFLQNNLQNAHHGSNVGDGPLNTLELQITDPCVPSTSGDSFDRRNEPFVPSEAMDEEVMSPMSDVEINVINTDDNLQQPTNAYAQETITEMANYLGNTANEISDSMEVQAVVAAMRRYPNVAIRMRTHPVTRHRFRYRTDGIRYLEQSGRTSMSVNVLPILDGCLTNPYQSFWVQLTIVTTRRNPKRKVFLHQHGLIYNAVGAQQNGSGSCRIRLTDRNIRQRIITFRHLSIIKTRLNDYSFDLTPFDPLIVHDHLDHYTVPNEDQISTVKKAKQFDREYHTNNYQIVCQLMIKQRDHWHTTDLYCQTHVITDS